MSIDILPTEILMEIIHHAIRGSSPEAQWMNSVPILLVCTRWADIIGKWSYPSREVSGVFTLPLRILRRRDHDLFAQIVRYTITPTKLTKRYDNTNYGMAIVHLLPDSLLPGDINALDIVCSPGFYERQEHSRIIADLARRDKLKLRNGVLDLGSRYPKLLSDSRYAWARSMHPQLHITREQALKRGFEVARWHPEVTQDDFWLMPRKMRVMNVSPEFIMEHKEDYIRRKEHPLTLTLGYIAVCREFINPYGRRAHEYRYRCPTMEDAEKFNRCTFRHPILKRMFSSVRMTNDIALKILQGCKADFALTSKFFAWQRFDEPVVAYEQMCEWYKDLLPLSNAKPGTYTRLVMYQKAGLKGAGDDTIADFERKLSIWREKITKVQNRIGHHSLYHAAIGANYYNLTYFLFLRRKILRMLYLLGRIDYFPPAPLKYEREDLLHEYFTLAATHTPTRRAGARHWC